MSNKVLAIVSVSVFIAFTSLILLLYPNLASNANEESGIGGSHHESIERFTTSLVELEEEYDIDFESKTTDNPAGYAQARAHRIIDLLETDVLSQDELDEMTEEEWSYVFSVLSDQTSRVVVLTYHVKTFSEEERYIEDLLVELDLLSDVLAWIVYDLH
ncbi:hypothetical protein [Alkalibacillus haloalkaliphilus]|uniref:hypothetical protein n=1 Tax=Alkalibacillus haloalkaliphilus TaxID=94136 RepID=UPI000318FB34|nr:hypothetical protein [Alkalibacillus haloalkaliphilus]